MLYTISISFMINIRRSEVYSILRAAFRFVVTVSAFIIKYIHHFGNMYLPLYMYTRNENLPGFSNGSDLLTFCLLCW